MANLKDSAAARKAAKEAKSLVESISSSSELSPAHKPPDSAVAVRETKDRVALGLSKLTTENIAQMAPPIDIQKYAVPNPLDPPDTLPQVSKEQREKADAIYTGAIDAAYLEGRHKDLVTEVAKTTGKQYGAVGALYQALNKKEKAQGDAYDYHAQVETTYQKGLSLDVATHKSGVDAVVAAETMAQLTEKLVQAQIATHYAVADTKGKRDKLEAFQKTLGIIAANAQKS